MSISVKILIFIAGMVSVIIGIGLLFFPVAFEASAGIILQNDASLLSEVRSPGGALLVAGILILSGVFQPKFAKLAFQLSALVYLSYGMGRLVSLVMDGIPHQSIIMAMIVELVIGILCLATLNNYTKKMRNA